MYLDFTTEEHLNKFVSIYLDYSDDILENLMVKIKEKDNDHIVAGIYLKNEDSTNSYMGQLNIDDFNFKYTLFGQNKLNEENLKFNGNYPHMFYCQYWRKFLTTAIEKLFGEESAEDYVESFLSTNIGNVAEYKKLMQIVYRRSENNPFEPKEEKGKE